MLQRTSKLFVIGLLLTVLCLSGVVNGAEYDLEGEKIYFWQWVDYLAQFEEGGDYEGRLAELEEKYNFEMVKKEFPPNKTEQFMARLMAEDSTNDIWLMRSYAIPHLASKGALRPIGDLLPKNIYENAPGIYKNLANKYSYKGKQYGYIFNIPYPRLSYFVAFRKDMFERAGLKSLYEVYNNGNWDWDKFLEVAKKLTKDTDGDGKIDQYGLATNPKSFIHLTNGASRIELEDGKLVYSLNDSEAVKAFEFGRKLITQAKFKNTTWRNGNAGMKIQSLFRLNDWSQDYEWGAVPLPKGPDIDHNPFISLPYSGSVLALPSNSKYPAAIIQILSELWNPSEQAERIKNNIKEIAQDQKMAKILLEGFERATVPKYVRTNVLGSIRHSHNNPLGEAVWKILSGKKTAKSALDEIAPAAQKELDDLFNE